MNDPWDLSGKMAHISFIFCKKVGYNDEIEDTIYCSPAHELDEEFE